MALYPSKLTVFMFGFAIGVIIAYITFVSRTTFIYPKMHVYLPFNRAHTFSFEDNFYRQWLAKAGYSLVPVNLDYLGYSENKSLSHFLEYNLLKTHVNILCVMFVKNENNAYAALNTWMKRCNSHAFFGLKPEKYLDVKVMRPKSSWHYLCDVIRHVNTYSSDYMWVLFAPDDIYALPENLRYFVLGKNFQESYYFGHSAIFWNEHFNLAQAGYVLSKGSIKALVNKFNSSESCKASGKYWKNEDYHLGKHLSGLGIVPMDTRDKFGRGRFHLFTPAQLMAPGETHLLLKYWRSSLYPTVQGVNCCSPQSITFQGTNKDHIYFYHYLLYSLQRHREPGKLGNQKSNFYDSSDQVWIQFVRDELGQNVNLSSITPNKYYQLWSDKVEAPSIFNKKLRALLLGESDD